MLESQIIPVQKKIQMNNTLRTTHKACQASEDDGGNGVECAADEIDVIMKTYLEGLYSDSSVYPPLSTSLVNAHVKLGHICRFCCHPLYCAR